MTKATEKLKMIRMRVSDFMGIIYADLEVKDGLTQITGRGGQGKSTLVKFIEWMIRGPVAIKGKGKGSVVRTGSNKTSGMLELKGDYGHFIITRSQTEGGELDCDVKDQATGKTVLDKAKWLKGLVTDFSFDPLKFADMDGAEQIEELKKLTVADLDFEAFEKADERDTAERVARGRERDELEAEKRNINPNDLIDLPDGTVKTDEAPIFQKLTQANEAAQKAKQIDRAKDDLGIKAAAARRAIEDNERAVTTQKHAVDKLEEELRLARELLKVTLSKRKPLASAAGEAQAAYETAPVGEDVDIAAISEELQQAQSRNKRIDKFIATKADWDRVTAAIADKQTAWNAASDRIETRKRLRAEAIANIQIPVPGLTFEDYGPKSAKTQVYYQRPGTRAKLPLANFGEGERIRISTLLGIHLNPTLQAMCIQRGESLDEEGIEIIRQLAIEHKFQIVMARLETSGTIDVVMEDGRIKKNWQEVKA